MLCTLKYFRVISFSGRQPERNPGVSRNILMKNALQRWINRTSFLDRLTKYSAYFFLAIFAAYLVSGPVLGGMSYYAGPSASPQVQGWTVSCDYAALHIQKKNDKTFSHVFSFQTLPHHKDVKVIPCQPSLQILPTLSSSLAKPDSHSSAILPRNRSAHSQLFVFQEPDPPRFLS